MKNILDRKTNVRKNKILVNTILWFLEQKAIDKNDYDTFLEIHEKRRQYVHEMANILCNGISELDIQLFSKLLLLYQKINSWCDREIDNLGDNVESISTGYMIFLNLFNNDGVDNDDFYCKDILKWYNEYGQVTYPDTDNASP